MNNAPRQKTWLNRFAKTSTALIGGIQSAIGNRKISSEVLEDIEETLILADLGHQVAADLVLELRARKFEAGIDSDAIRRLAAEQIAARLMRSSQPFSPATLAAEARQQGRPLVLMMVGANGSGKTTTIGKLAAKLSAAGVKTLVAAGDTFRAAATETAGRMVQPQRCALHSGSGGKRPGRPRLSCARNCRGRAGSASADRHCRSPPY